MNPPNWKTCDENELWRCVAWHLEGEGVSSVLVGGAVMSIYTEGSYRSGDLDMITDDLGRSLLPVALTKIGFTSGKFRHDKHPECDYLSLEFPRGPVELGEQFTVIPTEISVGTRKIELLSPTDCVKDRLAGYIHWKCNDAFNQPVLVFKKQGERINMIDLAKWCRGEGGSATFRKLLRHLKITP